MTFSGAHLTKADVARREAIHAGNCMACAQLGLDVSGSGAVQWHHAAGKKRHDLTAGLCLFHHMGRPWPGRTLSWCRENLGPSLAEGSVPFARRFGDGAALVALQNRALGILDEAAA